MSYIDPKTIKISQLQDDKNVATLTAVATAISTAVNNGNTAFGWGNHANGGYAAQSAVDAANANITTLKNAGYITASALSGLAIAADVNTALATKLNASTISAYAKTADITASLALKADVTSIPTSNSQLTNGAGYLTSVPAQSWNSITGKPTTLAASGITDGITAAIAASTYYPATNPTGFITNTALTPFAKTSDVNTALSSKLDTATALTAYQPKGDYLTSINASMVTNALGGSPAIGMTNSVTFSGVTLQTAYIVMHNSGYLPSNVLITAFSQNAAFYGWISGLTSTSFTINFNTAPVAGTNNLTVRYTLIK